MKKIEAILSPVKLEAVKDALRGLGIERITAFEAKEYTRSGGRALVFRGCEYVQEFPEMLKLEIVVADELVEKTVETIMSAAQAETSAEGRILVTTVDRIFHIRSRSSKERALNA